jgi:hypothetical protein
MGMPSPQLVTFTIVLKHCGFRCGSVDPMAAMLKKSICKLACILVAFFMEMTIIKLRYREDQQLRRSILMSRQERQYWGPPLYHPLSHGGCFSRSTSSHLPS